MASNCFSARPVPQHGKQRTHNKRNKDHVSSNCWDQRGLQDNSASLSSSFISSTPQCGGELELL